MSKERLTETFDKYNQCNDKNCKLGYCDRECEHYQKMVDKLAKYESLEEQGLLFRLRFKKGQKVYYIEKSCIDGSLFVTSMTYSYSCLDFPREYFATKDEAEEKLRELEGK